MKNFSSTFVALFLCGMAVSIQADEPMIKIVYRNIGPELSPDSFVAKPKTFYLWGATRSRTEELPDPALKLQELIISNGKDIWMVNLWDKTGRHIIDPGPTYNAHAPIVPSDPGTSPRVKDFEMAHEMEFMVKHQAKLSEGKLNGVPSVVYETTQEGLTLRLYLVPATKMPMGVSVYDGDHCLRQILYDEYTTNLKSDPSLFKPPEGIQMSEVR